jgi:hypothetical protein
MKRFIDSLRFSLDMHAAWLLVRLRMGDDIAQVVSMGKLRSNCSTYALREFTNPPPDARNRVPELGNVHVPDLSARSTIVNTHEARLSHFFTLNGIFSSQFWQEDTLQPRLSHQLTSPYFSRSSS